MAPPETGKRQAQAPRVAVPHIQVAGRIPMMVNPPRPGTETLYNTAPPLRFRASSPEQDDKGDSILPGPAESQIVPGDRTRGNVYPPPERYDEGPFMFRAERSRPMSASSRVMSGRIPGKISRSRPGSFSALAGSPSTKAMSRSTWDVRSLKRSQRGHAAFLAERSALVAPSSFTITHPAHHQHPSNQGTSRPIPSIEEDPDIMTAAHIRRWSSSSSRPMPGSFHQLTPPTLTEFDFEQYTTLEAENMLALSSSVLYLSAPNQPLKEGASVVFLELFEALKEKTETELENLTIVRKDELQALKDWVQEKMQRES
ncbi:uncharacterized protein PAC_14750 [Phialocephala subalpina]|uniref:Uncharacterized protein n=1 Tax=Phialocephala subalpina TaxID=576137 RepID=A0A1L7XIJ9_9HELO|nr:uncharacterized protein PAC_14750 [Phialocephala subalpina]